MKYRYRALSSTQVVDLTGDHDPATGALPGLEPCSDTEDTTSGDDANFDHVQEERTVSSSPDDEYDVEASGREVEYIETRAAALLPPGHMRLNRATISEVEIRPGNCVLRMDGDYFCIKYIVRNLTGGINILGRLLQRPQDVRFKMSKHGHMLCRIFPQYPNELVATLKTKLWECDDLLNDATLDSMPLAEVVMVRKVISTNEVFPAHSYMELGMRSQDSEYGRKTHSKDQIEDIAMHVCRFKFVEVFDTQRRKVIAHKAQRLMFDECDPGKRTFDVALSKEFRAAILKHQQQQQHQREPPTCRGPRPQKRSARPPEQSIKHHKRLRLDVDLTIDDSEKQATLKTKPRYLAPQKPKWSFGELCCGGGCVTRAAHQMGLHIKWVLDNWDVACQTQRLNGLSEQVLEMDVSHYLSRVELDESDDYVDIIHFSPPCQGQSRANRNTNVEQDAKNNAVALALQDILFKCRPRRMIVEQTDHVMANVNEDQFWRKMLRQFIDAGYSAQSMVLNSLSYGVPSSRKRLFIVASCPGESLPAIPKPTHGHDPELKPPVTINQCLRTIPYDASLHDRTRLRADHRRKARKGLPLDGNKPLPRIVTTKGIEGLHPSGRRWFTVREHMALMGLPTEHVYAGGVQGHHLRMAGNGVPVEQAKAVMATVIESLEETERMAEIERSEIHPVD